MFEASVDGEAYDMERWGQYFKPAGMGQATGDPVAKTSSRAASVDDEDDSPAMTQTPVDPKPVADKPSAAAPTASGESASRAQDILAMIRNRQKQ